GSSRPRRHARAARRPRARPSGSARAARSREPFLEDVQPADRGLDRTRRRLTEAADRRVAHALADLGDERELGLEPSERLARDAARAALPPGTLGPQSQA